MRSIHSLPALKKGVLYRTYTYAVEASKEMITGRGKVAHQDTVV